MQTRSMTRALDTPNGARPLVDERGHVVDTIRREPTRFSRLSNATRDLAGSPAFTVVLLLAVLIWLAAGPLVGFSKAWELSATAGAPIIGLILLVVIQHTQNRDDKAIHLKLNEVIRASEHASDGLIGIEDSPEVELSRLLSDYRRHAGEGRSALAFRSSTDHRRGWLGWRRRLRDAEGDLRPEHSFIFRSPEGRLHARAQSLTLFAKLADAVDDTTWLHHLERGDYSCWFREVVRDEALASVAARLEGPGGPSADDSRQQVISAITQRYRLFA
ncbi:MAG: low affinity iron permease family protein [Egibacteraceae bacterium]